LPTGSYVPNFHEGRALPAAPALPKRLRVHRAAGIKWMSAAIVCGLLALLSLTGWMWPHAAEPFEAFWQPLFDQKNPVLIVMAHPIVYRPSGMPESDLNGLGTPLQHGVQPAPERNFVAVREKYVALGDSLAAFHLGELMGRHGHSAHMRIASKLQFADLCDSGTVLIGAYTNRWTMELMKALRLRFVVTSGKPGVIDSKTGRMWTLGGKTDDESSSEDYMVISRVLQNSTGQFVVTGAGLTQYGTEETGRILTTPAVLNGILARLPAGWQNRNVQVLLHSEVVGDSPARPVVVSSSVW
jgi:hypothetical protein